MTSTMEKDIKEGSRSPSEESDQGSTDGDDELSYSLDKLENLVLSFLAEFLHFQNYDTNDAIHAEIPFVFNLKRKLQLMNHLLRRFEPKFQKYFVIQIMDDLHELTKKRSNRNNPYLKPFTEIKELLQRFAEKTQSASYSSKTPEHRAKNLSKLINDLKSSPYNLPEQKESGVKAKNMDIESPRVVPAVHFNNVMNQLFVKEQISPRSQIEQNSRKPTPISRGNSSTHLDFSTYPFPPYSTRALAAYAREKTKDPPDKTPIVPPPSPQYEYDQNSGGSPGLTHPPDDNREVTTTSENTLCPVPAKDLEKRKEKEPCSVGDTSRDTLRVQCGSTINSAPERNTLLDCGDFDSRVRVPICSDKSKDGEKVFTRPEEKFEQKKKSEEKIDSDTDKVFLDSGSGPQANQRVSSRSDNAYKSTRRYRNSRPKNSADEKLYGFLEQADMIKRTIRESREVFFGTNDSNNSGVHTASGRKDMNSSQNFDIRNVAQSTNAFDEKLPQFSGTRKSEATNQAEEMAKRISFPIRQVQLDLNVQSKNKLKPESQITFASISNNANTNSVVHLGNSYTHNQFGVRTPFSLTNKGFARHQFEQAENSDKNNNSNNYLSPSPTGLANNQNPPATNHGTDLATYKSYSTTLSPEDLGGKFRAMNSQYNQNQKSKNKNVENHALNCDPNEYDDNTKMVQIPYGELLRLEAAAKSARASKRDEPNSNDSTTRNSLHTQNQYADGTQTPRRLVDQMSKTLHQPSIDFRGIEKAREKLIAFAVANEQPESSNTFYSNGENRETDARLTSVGKDQIRTAILTNDRRNLLTDKMAGVHNKHLDRNISVTHRQSKGDDDVQCDSPIENFYRIVTPSNSGRNSRKEVLQRNEIVTPKIPEYERTVGNKHFHQNDMSQYGGFENVKPEDRFNNFVKNERHNSETPDYQNYARQFALMRHLLPAYKRKDPVELTNVIVGNKNSATTLSDQKQKSVKVPTGISELQLNRRDTNVQVYKYTVKPSKVESGLGILPGILDQTGRSDSVIAANLQNSIERKFQNAKKVDKPKQMENFQNKMTSSVDTSQLKPKPIGTGLPISQDHTQNTFNLAQRLSRVIQKTLDCAALDIKQKIVQPEVKQDVSKVEDVKEKQNWELIRNEALLGKQDLNKKVKLKNTNSSPSRDESKPLIIRTVFGETHSTDSSKSAQKRDKVTKSRRAPALRIASSNSSKTTLLSMRAYSTRNISDESRVQKSSNRNLSNVKLKITDDSSLQKQFFPKSIETYDWPLGCPLAERYYNNTNTVFSAKYKTGAGRVNYPNGKPCILTSGSKPLFQLLVLKAPEKIERYKMKVLAAFDTSGEGIIYDSNGKMILEYDGVGGNRFDTASGSYVKWNWCGSGNLRLRYALNSFLTLRVTDLRRIQLLFNGNIKNMRLSIGKGSRSQQFMRGVPSMENQTKSAIDDDCVKKFIHSLAENETF